MQGTIRSYKESTLGKIKERIQDICDGTAKAMGCTVDVSLEDMYPAVVNHKVETEHVIRLAKKWFGEEHFS
jgi:hippurate hydrolase